MSRRSEQIEQAVRHLRRDAVLREVIRRVGPYRLKLRRDRFATLCQSIVSQQVSRQAAKTIMSRLKQLVARDGLSAAAIQKLTFEQLRSVGLSQQKASYMQDLARQTANGHVQLSRLGRLSDEEAIAELTKIRGIGRWTAEMLLIFSLGRMDVLPCDDLGIRSALCTLYQLDELPDRETCISLARPWRPYASVASWYCWRSRDLPQ